MTRLSFVLLFLAFTSFAHARTTAVIFDCDGVLVDTEKLKYEAWREALAPYKIDLKASDYTPLVGNDNKHMLKALSEKYHAKIGDDAITAKEDAYHRIQMKGVPHLERGIALVKYLRAHQKELNLKLGLASGGMKTEILENLRQTHLEHSFDQVASGHDDLKEIKDPAGTNKPKPYIYLKVARLLGVDPKDVVVFEDSSAGVVAAADAGMTVFAVPNEFTKGQDFTRAKEVLTLDEPTSATIKHVLSER